MVSLTNFMSSTLNWLTRLLQWNLSLPFPCIFGLRSLQRCVSSLHSWFLHNGLVFIPTKTEAICFGTFRPMTEKSRLLAT